METFGIIGFVFGMSALSMPNPDIEFTMYAHVLNMPKKSSKSLSSMRCTRFL